MKVPSSNVRNDLTYLMNRVSDSDEIIEVQKYGRTEVVIISKSRFDRLTRSMFEDK